MAGESDTSLRPTRPASNARRLQQRSGERAFVSEEVRRGHQDMAGILAPLDQKIAARQARLDLAPGKRAPRRGDAGRARSRAASTRQACAPLPGAELEM